jgi:glyoxylase-like metal-dependent hydrolase (beta-lactamase superfamily II)
VRTERPSEQGVERVADDVFRLELPIPFPSATVNAYLVVDEPLVLVDVGANMPGAVEVLQDRLGALGYGLRDIGLILLTHPHVDHSGLAGILAGHTDAEIAALDAMVPFVEDYWALAARDEAFSLTVLERYGMAPEAIEAIQPVLREERQWSSQGTVGRPLADAAAMTLANRTLTAYFRPGHSPVDTVFHDAGHGLLFGGDHLLERMSSSPALWPPLTGPPDLDARPRPLLEYRRSLGETRALAVELTLPGHGPPIASHRKVVDYRLALQERRVERLTAMLADGPASAVELAGRTWGRFAAIHPFRSLCEIVVHMDLLIEAGAAREVLCDDTVHYERTA